MAMIGKVLSLRRRIRDEMDKMLVAMIGKVLSLRRQIRERRDVILVAMIWMVTIVYWSHSMMTHDDAVWIVVSKEMEKES